MKPVVLIENVSRVFRGFLGLRRVCAVRDLSIEVRPGEIFGLLGPNGSGKTTTIQMLMGLLAPTAGRIEVFGASPRSRAVRRRVGFLPEEFAGQNFLSGEENLLFYGGFFGLSRSEVKGRAEALLKSLDLWDDRSRRLREYSKGMRRRIGLAQSLLHDPELIVLDEPTNGLDPLGIRTVKRMLLDLRARGRTLIISSHILGEMEGLCDRIALIDRGSVLIEGRLPDLLVRPDCHRIKLRGKVPAAEDLSRALADKDLRLESIESDRTSLEEFFLRTIDERRSARPAE